MVVAWCAVLRGDERLGGTSSVFLPGSRLVDEHAQSNVWRTRAGPFTEQHLPKQVTTYSSKTFNRAQPTGCNRDRGQKQAPLASDAHAA